MTPPTLQTERLTLRPHVPEDFPAYRDLMVSDRSRFMGGPFSPREAWGMFCHDAACWTLFGHGALAIERGSAFVGQVGISAGPLFPERELGWFLFAEHEGQGYATEAARGLRRWFYENFSGRLVSYTDPHNDSSIAVATRLGAVRDFEAPRQDPEDFVFLHPQPEAQP